MPLLANVYVATARSPYDSGKKTTGAPQEYLTNIPAHIGNDGSPSFDTYGDAEVSSDYVLTVDSGVDIAKDDRVTSITRIIDGSDWPGDTSSNEYWLVVLHKEKPPGILPHRKVYIKRIRGGGKAY